MEQPLLIIGHTWPEPSTTGAGVRMMQLIDLFQQLNYAITFASTASRTPYSANLEDLGVQTASIQLNHTSFDGFVADLNPAVVLYDRFMTEEQFGWRVAQQCPSALRILDTEDLHFLRKARESAKNQDPENVTRHLYSDIAKRELASILRCDLSLIISQAEYTLLTHRFAIAEGLLLYIPFLSQQQSSSQRAAMPGFDQRSGFMTVGNGMHPPNEDALIYLAEEIWPLIRAKLPEAQVYNYGAYTATKVQALHQPEAGFHIMGWIEDLNQAVQTARVCLAPLRFGAGLKGKIMTALQCGTPIVTTEMGAEGFTGLNPIGPQPTSPQGFANSAIALYQEKALWSLYVKRGFELLDQNFQSAPFTKKLSERLSDLTAELHQHRQQHFLGQILHHHSLQSTKYMSKWIEAKNKLSS